VPDVGTKYGYDFLFFDYEGYGRPKESSRKKTVEDGKAACAGRIATAFKFSREFSGRALAELSG